MNFKDHKRPWRKISFLLGFIWIFSFHMIAQTIQDDLKSYLLLGFAENITWPNEQNFLKYKIGVIDKNDVNFESLERLASTTTIKGKPIQVYHIKDLGTNTIRKMNLIFIGTSFLKQNEFIWGLIERRNIFVITDDSKDKKYFMLNLSYNNKKKKYIIESNRDNIIVEGFDIDRQLIKKKSDVNLRAYFNQLKKDLEIENNKVREQKEKIITQLESINSYKSELDRLEDGTSLLLTEIETGKTEYQNLINSIKSQREVYNRLQRQNYSKEKNLIEQTKELTEKEIKMYVQDLNLKQKVTDLEKTANRLDSLRTLSDNQAQIIADKETILKTNQRFIIAFVLLILTLITLGVSVLRAYIQKKNTAEVLEEKVIERTKKLETVVDHLNSLIQQRKYKELQLKESEERYRALISSAGDAMLIVSYSQFIDCNQKALELLKYPKEEIIGKFPWDISPDIQPNGSNSRELMLDIIEEVLQGRHKHFTLTLLDYTGNEKKFDVTLNLVDAKKELFIAILRDVSKREKMEQDILNAIIQTEEKERSRIAQEIHDGLGPLFSTLKLYIQSLQEEQDLNEREELGNRIFSGINDAISGLREISNNISPHMLQNLGLTAALQNFIDRITQVKDIKIKYKASTINRLPEIVEITLYRVVTELITNTLKHANASEINIDIKKKGDTLTAEYADNGDSFKPSKAKNKKEGMGMYNMQNRIQSLNGIIVFSNSDSGGAWVKISLKLNNIKPQLNE